MGDGLSADMRFSGLSIDASVLGSPATSKLFQGLGVLHVRNAVPLPALAHVRDEITATLDWIETEVGERVPYINGSDANYGRPMMEAYHRLTVILNNILSPEFPHVDGIMAIAGCSEICYVIAYAREARGDGGPSASVPFHQDYQSFLVFTGLEKIHSPKRMLTCWIPLDKIDEQTPSIQYIPAHLEQSLPIDTTGMLDMTAVGSALDKLPRWVPDVKPGDVMLHDQFTLHRSLITPERTKLRRSFELRFVMR